MERQDLEQRLDRLREEAGSFGQVSGNGTRAVGGPIPFHEQSPSAGPGSNGGLAYYNQPLIKQPVWTWQISIYFFVGGLAGMAAVIGVIAGFHGEESLLRVAMWLACGGAILSPVLLVWDLGRPWLFLNMLRVFKPRSPMSTGVYLLSVFGAAVIPGALLVEADVRGLFPYGTVIAQTVHVLALVCASIGALAGLLLSTYTGVLIGVTVVPAWFSHHRLLPIHFGTVGLGCAAAALQLFGFGQPSLIALAIITSFLECCIIAWLEVRNNGEVDRALRAGLSGSLLRIASLCSGPLALAGQVVGIWILPVRLAAAAVFLLGGLLSRFGWIAAGHHSAKDPAATLAAQR